MNASAWEKWRVEQHTSSPLTRFHSFPYCLTERYRLYEKLLYHFWCKSTFPIDSKSTVFINLLSSTLKFSPKMKRWLTDLWNHTLMGVFFQFGASRIGFALPSYHWSSSFQSLCVVGERRLIYLWMYVPQPMSLIQPWRLLSSILVRQ